MLHDGLVVYRKGGPHPFLTSYSQSLTDLNDFESIFDRRSRSPSRSRSRNASLEYSPGVYADGYYQPSGREWYCGRSRIGKRCRSASPAAKARVSSLNRDLARENYRFRSASRSRSASPNRFFNSSRDNFLSESRDSLCKREFMLFFYHYSKPNLKFL